MPSVMRHMEERSGESTAMMHSAATLTERVDSKAVAYDSQVSTPTQKIVV